MTFFSHSKALVDAGARIGRGSRVWAFAHIQKGARVGVLCNIGDYASIEKGAVLGDGVTVKNGVQIWEGVIVENGVFIGPEVAFTNHTVPRAFIKKDKRLWLSQTRLREGCSLGANATILPGLTIGRYALVAAGAVVTENVPDFALVAGHPAAFRSWRCFCGVRLDFVWLKSLCKGCGSIFSLKPNGGGVLPRRAGQRLLKTVPRGVSMRLLRSLA